MRTTTLAILLLTSAACATAGANRYRPTLDALQCGEHLTVTVHDPSLQGPVAEAVAAWNQAIGQDYLVLGEGGVLVEFVDTLTSHESVASTHIRAVKGCITSAYIALRSGDWETYDAAHRQTILRHELGHALGLGHTKDVHSLMAPELSAYRADHPAKISADDVRNAGF